MQERLKDIRDKHLEQDLDGRYQISNSRNDPINIYTYVHAHQDDPAFTVCQSICIRVRRDHKSDSKIGLYSEIERPPSRTLAQSRI